MSWDDAQPARAGALRRPRWRWVEPAAAVLLRRLMRQIEIGSVTVTLPSGMEVRHVGRQPGPHGRLVLHRWRFVARILTGGDVGFARAYMNGDWSTPDLRALLSCLQKNEETMQAAWEGSAVKRLAGRLYHATRLNTRRGSRRNIEAHYDLGNSFYRGWLDAGMNYSSALYTSDAMSLEDAQSAKLDRAIDFLQVKPGDRVLEIGCGWGALAERLATKKGVHVTGITLSKEQLAYAEARMQEAGATDHASLKLQDYRDTDGTFDAIVSIEMLEAAGEAYWPAYFAKLKSCLRPGGVAVLQVITIEAKRFSDYQRRPDFIQHYIFPGGMLPTVPLIEHHAAAAGLKVQSLETFGESYARTLAAWRDRYLRAGPPADAPQLGTTRFRKMWEYYLAYCEVGFHAGALDVGLYQIVHAGELSP